MYTFPHDLEGLREQRNRMNENFTWHPTWQQVDNDSWSTTYCIEIIKNKMCLMQSKGHAN